MCPSALVYLIVSLPRVFCNAPSPAQPALALCGTVRTGVASETMADHLPDRRPCAASFPLLHSLGRQILGTTNSALYIKLVRSVVPSEQLFWQDAIPLIHILVLHGGGDLFGR